MSKCNNCYHNKVCTDGANYKTVKSCKQYVTAADVQEVKHGAWENTNTPNQLRCSNCDIIHFIAQYPHGEINYCPNCGARMDGKDGEKE